MKHLALLFLILFQFSIFAQSNDKKFVLKGLGDSEWGMSYDALLEQLKKIAVDKASTEKVEILYQEKDKYIHVRRNDIEYKYRFYTTPQVVRDLEEKEDKTNPNSTTNPNNTTPTGNPGDTTTPNQPTNSNNSLKESTSGASLYSVEVKFNILESDLLKYRLEKKFGKATKEVLDEKKTVAAFVWDLSDGNITGEEQEIQNRLKERYGASKKADLDVSKLSGERLWDVKDGQSLGKSTLDGGYIVQWVEPYQSKSYTKRVDYFGAKLMNSLAIDYKYYYSSKEIDTLKKVINFVEKTGSGGNTNTTPNTPNNNTPPIN